MRLIWEILRYVVSVILQDIIGDILLFIRNYDATAYSEPPQAATAVLAAEIQQTFSNIDIKKPRASAKPFNFLPASIFRDRKTQDYCKDNLTLNIDDAVGVLRNLSNSTDMTDFAMIYTQVNFSQFADDMIAYADIYEFCTSNYKKYLDEIVSTRKLMGAFADSRVTLGEEFIFEKESQVIALDLYTLPWETDLPNIDH